MSLPARPPRPARPIEVVSHRTNAGDAPENTLAGMEAAVRDGCAAVEVDIRATRDGALVLLHDETLERTTGDPRRIDAVTLEEVRALTVLDPFGTSPPQRVPTLTEALRALGGRIAIEIDLPMRGLEAAIAAEVRAADAEAWTWFTAHPPEDAALLRHACPGARVYLSVAPQPTWVRDLEDAIEVAARLRLAGINPSLGALTPSAVHEAHERGLLVGTWTVNAPADIERALDLGVDAITTDVPTLVTRAIARRAGSGG
ncbi:MAG: glycerophosphodiester phosphodiesterase [Chloroflexi bacterium]|nr:glycerophosphodiester phosphodiesterase [Chloroflexota bacterium]